MSHNVIKVPAGVQVFFTSDTHYFHAAMMKPDYAARPFADVPTMNAALVANWNDMVTSKDYVFHLGDLSTSAVTGTVEILKQLRGVKFWVAGNHDSDLRRKEPVRAFFQKVEDLLEVRIPDPEAPEGQQVVILCHYPIDGSWNKSHYGAFHLHGHCHGNKPENFSMKRMDVGVDAVAKRFTDPDNRSYGGHYRPILYPEVKLVLAKRRYVVTDHHVPREKK